MKQVILSFASILVVTSLVACGGGGGGSNSATYLPAGTYSIALSNPSPASCGAGQTVSMTSNGQGQLCDSSGCQSVNLANNPCLNESIVESGVTISGTWSSCTLYSSGVLTAVAKISISETGQVLSCTYNMTATPQ